MADARAADAKAYLLQQQAQRLGEEEGEGVGDTGRLFVRNLAYTATEGDLSEAFGPLGELQEVHLVLDRCVRGTASMYLLVPTYLPTYLHIGFMV